MGGICGFISKQNITLNDLNAMNHTLKRRGPFDQGSEIYVAHREYMAGLASCRLSIRDSSYDAHQPMRSTDGRASVVFDGELYNADSLRAELSDYPFRSSSDTEIILAAYLKWGISFPERLDGMFAIALYDADEEAIFLIRDPLGEKPLYYELDDSSGSFDLYFGSTLSPIMRRPGFRKRIDERALFTFLKTQYVAEPGTLFRNVRKVSSGTVLRFSPSSGLSEKNASPLLEKRFYDPEKELSFMRKEPLSDPEEGARILRDLILDSVRKDLCGNVPFGIALNGDPFFLLAALMAERARREPVRTYAPGRPDTPYPPLFRTKEMAGFLGSDHTMIHITDKELLSVIRKLPRIFDEPSADPSLIIDALVADAMAKDVPLAISGYCPLPETSVSKEAAVPVAKRLTSKILSSIRSGLERSSFSGEEDDTESLILRMIPSFSKKEDAEDPSLLPLLSEKDREKILFASDRIFMYHSVEIRHPLYDLPILSHAFRMIPSEDSGGRFGTKKNDTHVINKAVRILLQKELPEGFLTKTSAAYDVPVGAFLNGPLKQQLLDMCSGTLLSNQGIFDAAFVKETAYDYLKRRDPEGQSAARIEKLIWNYFVFQQWYEEYFEN